MHQFSSQDKNTFMKNLANIAENLTNQKQVTHQLPINQESVLCPWLYNILAGSIFETFVHTIVCMIWTYQSVNVIQYPEMTNDKDASALWTAIHNSWTALTSEDMTIFTSISLLGQTNWTTSTRMTTAPEILSSIHCGKLMKTGGEDKNIHMKHTVRL